MMMLLGIFFLLDVMAWAHAVNTKVLHIGGVLPLTNEMNNALDPNGATATAAFVMAVEELIPMLKKTYNVTLLYDVRDSKGLFGRSAEAALQLATTTLGNTPLHTIIGADEDTIAEAIAHVCNDYDVAQVSYGADASELGSASAFPDFLRVNPSNGYEAYALADLLGKTYGWKRVVVVYTTDKFGSWATQLFQYRAKQLGITTVATIAITPGQAITNETKASLTQQIQSVKDLDGRIWVLLTDDAIQVARFFNVAQSVLSQNTYFFGVAAISTQALWQNTGLSFDTISTFLNGYIGIQRALFDWMMTPVGKDFITRLHAQKATTWKDEATGNMMCSSATDDSGVQKLYDVQVGTNGNVGCIGLDYLSLAADGSTLNPRTGYIYDAVYMAVLGIVEYCKSNFLRGDGSGDWYIPPKISGAALTYYMTKNVVFNGTTGLVQLSTGIPAVRTL